jgi:hypothetical protein
MPFQALLCVMQNHLFSVTWELARNMLLGSTVCAELLK